MREIRYVGRFKRDYKREKSGRHGKTLDAALMEVVRLLAADEILPRRNFDHPLSGDWADHRDCHIKPDGIASWSPWPMKYGCATIPARP